MGTVGLNRKGRPWRTAHFTGRRAVRFKGGFHPLGRGESGGSAQREEIQEVGCVPTHARFASSCRPSSAASFAWNRTTPAPSGAPTPGDVAIPAPLPAPLPAPTPQAAAPATPVPLPAPVNDPETTLSGIAKESGYNELWAKRSEKPLQQIYGHIDRISNKAGSLLDRYQTDSGTP